MRACALTGFPCSYFFTALLLALQAPVLLAEEDSGWSTGNFIPATPWREQQVELPAYPAEGHLLEAAIASGSYPYRVFIDPGSLSVDADRVVRYAAVVTSAEGARNVAYEGIRCSTREYRRYAYGANGSWQVLDDMPWERLRESGMGHYRYQLYRYYLCDTTSDTLKRDEILRRLRYSRGGVLYE
jgi:hypothetical protein